MKTIVVYSSRTGFTKQYAEWLSSALECECKPLADVDAFELKDYPLVVYGGWVRNGEIDGLPEIRGMIRGKLMVFAVGALPKTRAVRERLEANNELAPEDLYYLEGGMKHSEYGLGTRRALRLYQHTLSLGNQKNLSPEQRFFLNNIGRDFDHTDRDSVIELYRKVEELRGETESEE